MGVVYRAMDDSLRRAVALEVLPREEIHHKRRFLREARAAAAVQHPNIATVFEVGEADGYAFIAMEYVEGESLRERLWREISVREALRIGKAIARAMVRAHE